MPIFQPKTKKISKWQKKPIRKKPDVKKSKFVRKKLKTRPQRRVQKKYSIKNFFVLLIFLFLLGSVVTIISLTWLTRNLPNPEKLLERKISQSTKIFDQTGQVVLYEIFAEERRTMIDLSEIPQHLISATLVAEDRDFFTHPGFDLKAIARAIMVDLIQGRKVQGASTITQQFIKNAFLTRQKTYTRKIKELVLAYQIEKKFSKQEILQMYFNEIPYGSNAYGAEAASQIYFAKSVRDLTLDEAALLAATAKAPTYYSPRGNNQEELIGRKNYILDGMAEEGFITQELADKTKNIDTLEKIIARRENIIAPHFVFYVKALLTEKYGERQVERGGLRVITTLDINKQKIAEQAIEKYAERNEKNFQATNAALVALDVATGQIVAMVVSKDFFDESIDGQVNVTTRNRQPGSSFKPIVYAAAFEKGYTPETILFDVETSFGPAGPEKEDYMPKNYNEKYYGPVTMRQALAGSLNIPGVKTLYLTGIDRALNLAQKMGYTTLTDKNRYGLSLVLGGGEIKLLEHVAAFAIFAREGKKIPTISILKVEDNKGNILEENKQKISSASEIIDPQITRLINNILSDNQSRAFVFGEQNFLTLNDRPVAAKTGTTNDSRDAWTIGYTPDLAAGVWVGNNRNQKMGEKADGSSVAAPIWHQFMTQALLNTPVKTFTPPERIKVDKPILKGEMPGEITLKIDKISGKLATELTPLSLVIEKTFKKYYPILYYLNKNDPQGPVPENPAQDPQYTFWEQGIKDWLQSLAEKTEEEKQEITETFFEIPPTEYDDIHIPINQPSLNILTPKNGAVIDGKILELNLEAMAPRGVKKIICYLDDIPLDIITLKELEIKKSLYQCFLNLAGVSAGEHQIKAAVFDDVDNIKTQKIWIITSQSFESKLSWLNPKNNETIQTHSLPLTLSILTPAVKIKMLRFFGQNLTSLKTSLIGTVFNPETSGKIDFIWAVTESGKYKLWAEITDFNNRITISEEIEIEIK